MPSPGSALQRDARALERAGQIGAAMKQHHEAATIVQPDRTPHTEVS
ncbi:MAG TPA: hypothetical protein VGU74_07340 [Gemmatimonadales bacterium]|nr:hypothetical protein [Gemmatimonadales bacterium]